MITLLPRLSTRFHRKLASRKWVLSLATHVERAIAARDDYETSDGRGVVFSKYNESRFLGPLSVCKYFFIVSVEVSRIGTPADYDRYEACVEFHPDTSTFTTRYETFDTKETRRMQAEVEAQRRAVAKFAASQLRDRFENREAIYVQHLIRRVRVTDIQPDRFEIAAEVEEIPTVGLETRIWRSDRRSGVGKQRIGPIRGIIRTSDLTIPDGETWKTSGATWSLYFAPHVIQGIVDLAARWPNELSMDNRFEDVHRFLENQTL